MRRTHFTVLIVCEGWAEHEFARVIRDLYLPRNCGTSMQAKNSRRGMPHALAMAIELRALNEYDAYGLIVDTDQHWDDVSRSRARAVGIVAVENTPCLEATLLQVDARNHYQSTPENKQAFASAYGGPAHHDGIIRRNFPRAKFDSARTRVAAIDHLLNLIRVGRVS
jgi:hypothetical protein